VAWQWRGLGDIPTVDFWCSNLFFFKSRLPSPALSCPVRNPHPLALVLALPPTLAVPPALSLLPLPSLSPSTSLSPSPSLSLSFRVPPTSVLGPSTTPHGYGNPLLQLFYRLHNSSSKWIQFGISVGVLVIAGASLDSASTCLLTQHPSRSPSRRPFRCPFRSHSCRPSRSLSAPPLSSHCSRLRRDTID
jgi:hypothetical protein